MCVTNDSGIGTSGIGTVWDIEDGRIVLQRDDAPRAEALAVEVAQDAIVDRQIVVARPHEIGMERMRLFAFGGRTRAGRQPLADHLPAEHAALGAGVTCPTIEIDVARRHIQQGNQIGNRLGSRGRHPVVPYDRDTLR